MSLLFKQKVVEKPTASYSKRPRRAAAITKTYKEPETDDSQSELEEILAPKAKNPFPNLKCMHHFYLFKEKYCADQNAEPTMQNTTRMVTFSEVYLQAVKHQQAGSGINNEQGDKGRQKRLSMAGLEAEKQNRKQIVKTTKTVVKKKQHETKELSQLTTRQYKFSPQSYLNDRHSGRVGWSNILQE